MALPVLTVLKLTLRVCVNLVFSSQSTLCSS